MKCVFCFLLLMSSCDALAAFNQCIGVYVGRINIDDQGGLSRVVFLEGPEKRSGSYWVYFTGWDNQAKQSALSVLMAAKMSGHRVDVYTRATDKCSVGSGRQIMAEIDLSTNF